MDFDKVPEVSEEPVFESKGCFNILANYNLLNNYLSIKA